MHEIMSKLRIVLFHQKLKFGIWIRKTRSKLQAGHDSGFRWTGGQDETSMTISSPKVRYFRKLMQQYHRLRGYRSAEMCPGNINSLHTPPFLDIKMTQGNWNPV